MQQTHIVAEPGVPRPGDDSVAETLSNTSPERWVFACGTEFHLFIAYILRSMAPPGCHCTLVLQVNHRTAAFVEDAEQVGVWDRVVIAQGDHEEPDQTLLTLGANEAGRFFYFSYGFPALTSLFTEAVRQGWIICLADEGFLTYQPQTSLQKWLALNPLHAEIAKGFDYGAVSEIWLLSPWLFLEQTHASIHPIDAHAFIDKLRADPDAAAAFRRFFRIEEGWSNRSFSQVVYLRQYFSALGTLAEPLDAYLDREFRKGLNRLEVCIKDHPGHRNAAYGSEGVLLDYKGPLEALVVARMAAGEPLPEWIVSPISSAVANCAMLGAGAKFVYLYKIVEQFCDWVGPDRDDLLARCNQALPGKQFYIPESWDEYIQLIVNFSAARDANEEDASVATRSFAQDLRAMNVMLLEQAKAAQERDRSFEQQKVAWHADAQTRQTEAQQAHNDQEQHLRKELTELQQHIEAERVQAREREEQRSQQVEQQVLALKGAAAAQVEQLHSQIVALQQDLLNRERIFTEQWTVWQAAAQTQLAEAQQAHDARELQLRNELTDLRQRMEAERAESQQREEQSAQQAEQHILALKGAAAAQAEQLQVQIVALQQDLLNRERAFTEQWTVWHADAQTQLAEAQQAHDARELQLRSELTDLRQRMEAERAQSQQREEQSARQAEQHILALKSAAAAQAEQLQVQIVALQQDLLNRERAFTEQWTVWHDAAQTQLAQAQQAHQMREIEWRREAQRQIDNMRDSANHYAAQARALADRVASLQSTWWWRLSMPWRRSSNWPDIAMQVFPPADAEVPRSPASQCVSVASSEETKHQD